MTVMSMIKWNVNQLRDSAKEHEREAIHSGHFMVSEFEAEDQDDDDQVAIPVPEENESKGSLQAGPETQISAYVKPNIWQQLSIETSLSKLFHCMSLAYRQKLTSPKWNMFKGLRLRWKDKIRLNNVIWRCWHIQFVNRKRTLVCQFASPLDIHTHNKPEAIVMEGKYWKRRLHAVKAEYKKWRMFYRNQLFGRTNPHDTLFGLEGIDWQSGGSVKDCNMLVDDEYMDFVNDTLFTTISANQPFAFPDSREIARGAGLADFIQPSLGPLQPNLDDFMDMEPFQELLQSSAKNEVFSGDGNINVKPDVDYFMQEPSSTWVQGDYCRGAPLIGGTGSLIRQIIAGSSSGNLTPSVLPGSSGSVLCGPSSNVMTGGASSALPPALATSSSGVISASSVAGPSSNVVMASSPVHNASPRTVLTTSQQPPIRSPPHITSSPPHVSNSPILQHTIPQDPIRQPLMTSGSVGHLGMHSTPVRPLHSSMIASMGPPPPRLTSYQPEPSVPVLTNLNVHRPPITTTTNTFYLSKQNEGKTRGGSSANQSSRHSEPAPLLNQMLTGSSYPFVKSEDNPKQQSQDVSFMMQTNIASPLRINESSFLYPPSGAGGTSKDLSHVVMPSSSSILPLTCQSNQPIMSNIQQGFASSATSAPSPDSPCNSESMSPVNMASPISSPSPSKSGHHFKDQRRSGHINAEQIRRCNIKNGFDTLHAMLPQVNQSPTAKVSKAVLLQKGAEYIRQLRSERAQLQQEIEVLRQQAEQLNSDISSCQEKLPATGAPVSRQKSGKMMDMFKLYVRLRTMDNWKFWILSLICEPLLMSFSDLVSTSSPDELHNTTLHWVDQHCTLVQLRPVVLNALRKLCTMTDVLADPLRLPIEAKEAVQDKSTKNKKS